jgi:hypothetical protein
MVHAEHLLDGVLQAAERAEIVARAAFRLPVRCSLAA